LQVFYAWMQGSGLVFKKANRNDQNYAEA